MPVNSECVVSLEPFLTSNDLIVQYAAIFVCVAFSVNIYGKYVDLILSSNLSDFFKMEKVRSVSQELNSRVPDSSVEKAATRAVLQTLFEYHDSFIMEVEREQSILALVFQQSRSLRVVGNGEVVMMEEKNERNQEETPCLQEIICMQEQYEG